MGEGKSDGIDTKQKQGKRIITLTIPSTIAKIKMY